MFCWFVHTLGLFLGFGHKTKSTFMGYLWSEAQVCTPPTSPAPVLPSVREARGDLSPHVSRIITSFPNPTTMTWKSLYTLRISNAEDWVWNDFWHPVYNPVQPSVDCRAHHKGHTAEIDGRVFRAENTFHEFICSLGFWVLWVWRPAPRCHCQASPAPHLETTRSHPLVLCLGLVSGAPSRPAGHGAPCRGLGRFYVCL